MTSCLDTIPALHGQTDRQPALP